MLVRQYPHRAESHGYRVRSDNRRGGYGALESGADPRLRTSPPRPELILVTHGGAMSVALHYLDGKPREDFVLTPLDNCAIRTVVLEPPPTS